MDDSIDELQRSQDRLYPPSSPSKSFSANSAHGLGTSFSQHSTSSYHPTSSALQRQTYVLATPGRILAGATAAHVSPVRIRVTVETEPPNTESHGEDAAAIESFDNRTTTITIPLKGEDEHKPVRKRGRPRRKSLGTLTDAIVEEAVTTPKLKATPKPSKDTAPAPASNTPARRGRPPKNKPLTPLTTMPAPIESTTPSSPPAQTTEEPVAKRTRRSTILNPNPDTTPAPVQKPSSQKPSPPKPQPRRNPMDFSAITPLHQKKSVVAAMQAAKTQTPVAVFTPWGKRRTKAELASRRIRERVPTPRKMVGAVRREVREEVFGTSSMAEGESVLGDSVDRGNGEQVDEAEGEQQEKEEEQEDEPEDEASASDEVEEEFEHDAEDSDAADMDDDDHEEGMTGMEDDTSVLDRSAVESEGFSMVSIDSLRDHRRLAEGEKSKQKPQSRLRIEQSMVEEEEDDLLGHLELSGRKSASPARRSPSVRKSKSPTRKPPSVRKSTSPARLSPLVRKSNSPVRTSQHVTSAGIEGGIFDGFDTGTRRQLQARFAIGELLAKRGFATPNFTADGQPSAASPLLQPNQSRPDRLPTPAQSESTEEDTHISHSTRLSRSPRQRERSPEQQPQTRGQRKENTAQAPITPSTSQHDESFDIGRTELFAQEVQRERDEVIKQAEAANASQVVVIEDTLMTNAEHEEVDEQQDEELECSTTSANAQAINDSAVSGSGVEPTQDLWLDEAESSLVAHPRPSRRALKRKAEPEQEPQLEPQKRDLTTTHDHNNLEDLLPVDTRPPRAKIPRTWRRVSGNHFLYSDEVSSPVRPVQPQLEQAAVRPVPERPLPLLREPSADVWLRTPGRPAPTGRAARAKAARQNEEIRQAPHVAAKAYPQPRRRVQGQTAKSMADEQYFSETEEQGEEESGVVEDAQDFRYASRAPEVAKRRGHRQEAYDDVIHQSIEEVDEAAETSHAQQLKHELFATTPARKSERSRQGERNSRQQQQQRQQHAERKDVGNDSVLESSSHLHQHHNEDSLLLHKPGKVYAPLFAAGRGGPRVTQEQQERKSRQRDMQSGERHAMRNASPSQVARHTTASITQNHNQDLYQTQSRSQPDAPAPAPTTTILNRLTTWLFSAPTAAPPPPIPATTTPGPTPASLLHILTTTNTWTRNHYLVLDHHYTRAVHASSTRLPAAYMAPWDSIPKGLRKCLGVKLVTPVGRCGEVREVGEGWGDGDGDGDGEKDERGEEEEGEAYKATVSESWIRIAFCFVDEARGKGVPMLCDGEFDVSHSSHSIKREQTVQGQGGEEGAVFPVRDGETGRVRRVKQEYWASERGAVEVVRRVYSLWVRDRMAGR